MQAVFRQLSQLYVDLQVISGAAVGICYGSFLGIQLVASRARVCKLHEYIAATLSPLHPLPPPFVSGPDVVAFTQSQTQAHPQLTLQKLRRASTVLLALNMQHGSFH